MGSYTTTTAITADESGKYTNTITTGFQPKVMFIFGYPLISIGNGTANIAVIKGTSCQCLYNTSVSTPTITMTDRQVTLTGISRESVCKRASNIGSSSNPSAAAYIWIALG